MTLRRSLIALLVIVVAVLVAMAALRSCASSGALAPAPLTDGAGDDGQPATDVDEPPVRAERRRTAPSPIAGSASATDAAVTSATEPTPPVDVGPLRDVVVTVLDPAGRPIRGVPIGVHGFSDFDVEIANAVQIGDPLHGPEPVVETEPSPATTDGSGVARMRVGVADGTVSSVSVDTDAWTGRVSIPRGDESGVGAVHVDLVVVPAFHLSGTVVHDDGSPIPNARVYVGVPLPGRASRMPRRLEVTRTDDEGRFACGVHAVPDTRILECYVMAPSVAGYPHRFAVRQGRIDDVVIEVPRGTVIRGRCVNEEGEPLSRVRVRGIMPGTGEITFSGPDGRFAMRVPGAGGGLIFYLAGRVQTGLRDLRGPPEGRDIGDVLIPRGGSIRGRVVDESGAAIVGAEVQIIEPMSLHAAAVLVSGADGGFASDLIGGGVHAIVVRLPGLTGDPSGLRCWRRFDGYTAGTLDAKLVVPPAVWLAIDVRDALSGERRPFTKGVFTLSGDDGSGDIHVHHVFEGGPLDGSFHAQVPGPGAYVVEVEMSVSGAVDSRRIVVGDTPPEPVVLTPR